MPWRLIGQLVDIRATATMVQIFHHGELVKTHVRKDKGRATDITDYPPEKAAGGPSYRTILAAGLEDIEADRPTGDAGVPAFLHGPAGLFADVIPFPAATAAAVTATSATSATGPGRRDDAGGRRAARRRVVTRTLHTPAEPTKDETNR